MAQFDEINWSKVCLKTPVPKTAAKGIEFLQRSISDVMSKQIYRRRL